MIVQPPPPSDARPSRPGRDPAADPNAHLFDAYATSYADAVNDSITASGEDVTYFARRKANEVARWLHAAGVRRPARALDFGCGTGLSTASLSETLGAECEVTGVDVSAESVWEARARHGGPARRFVHADAPALPFDDGTFDVVFTACVFHHIARGGQLHWSRELARVLRPGGVAFVFEHNPLNPVTVRAVRACPFDEGVELLRPGYTRALLAAAGLDAERPRFYFFFPSALRALRPAERWLGAVPLGAQYFVAARRPGADR
jgi:ubiquinone/menaquinone biosynthesis C-methylase UbiE